ncbi:hypothetical protein TCAP_04106 [Tolypocladium capitatum]|uniref:Uncharacterized protein n=1 Tax=Tolypocladium capitatum TaxID=45235 RepID=A0A2K3QEJ9_9HYPO|nr:hypothetical protein TCAP_04106 [Tolypocladium capitatum]
MLARQPLHTLVEQGARSGVILANLPDFLFGPALGDILAAHASKHGVVHADPLPAVLSAYIHRVVAAARVFAVVVDHTDELVLGHRALAHGLAHLPRQGFTRNLELQGITNLFPNLNGAVALGVELEALEVQDQHRRQRLDKYLLRSHDVLATGRVEVALETLRAGQSTQGIDDVADIRGSNVQLEWLVRLGGDGVLEARHTKLASEQAAKNLIDGRRRIGA